MKFNELGFEPQLQEGLEMMGFEQPTPIQEKAIPTILANKDLIACAQTCLMMNESIGNAFGWLTP